MAKFHSSEARATEKPIKQGDSLFCPCCCLVCFTKSDEKHWYHFASEEMFAVIEETRSNIQFC